MAAEANRSGSGGGSADSYIGSLISLTSKYEIRYEGVLYDINTEESSIGLRNVRSFGTEGRKKDGPQIPPNDKIYEYILFRGSDIKDLQVKSSPVPTTPPIDHDPAIIQSHYSHPPAVPTSFPPPVSGPVTDHSSQTSQMGPPAGSSFQGGMPLHQSGGSLGPWGSSPLPPNVNGSGLAMPMYWQGYYPPPTGLSMPPSVQQPMLRPPTGLSTPPSMQQPMQYPNINSSLLSGSTNLPVSSLPDIGSPLLQSSSNHSQPLTSTTLSSTLPLTFSTVHSAALGLDTTSVSGYPPAPISASNSFVSPPPSNIFGTIGNGGLTSDKPKNVTGYAAADQKRPKFVNPGASSLTPSQILKSGPTAFSSSMSSELAHKDVEVVQISPPEPPRAPAETQPPILPLPSPPDQRVLIAGVGDFPLEGVTSLADSSLLPATAKKKGLRDKERVSYAAPISDAESRENLKFQLESGIEILNKKAFEIERDLISLRNEKTTLENETELLKTAKKELQSDFELLINEKSAVEADILLLQEKKAELLQKNEFDTYLDDSIARMLECLTILEDFEAVSAKVKTTDEDTESESDDDQG